MLNTKMKTRKDNWSVQVVHDAMGFTSFTSLLSRTHTSQAMPVNLPLGWKLSSGMTHSKYLRCGRKQARKREREGKREEKQTTEGEQKQK